MSISLRGVAEVAAQETWADGAGGVGAGVGVLDMVAHVAALGVAERTG